MAKIYIHKKTGNLYKLIGTALDCTNSTEGRRLVLYTRADIKSTTYARELNEFLNKFEHRKDLEEYNLLDNRDDHSFDLKTNYVDYLQNK